MSRGASARAGGGGCGSERKRPGELQAAGRSRPCEDAGLGAEWCAHARTVSAGAHFDGCSRPGYHASVVIGPSDQPAPVRPDEHGDGALGALSRLHALTAALAAARTLDEVGDVVVQAAIDVVGARAGAVFVVHPGRRTIEAVRAAGYAEAVIERFRGPFAITAPIPVAEVARTGAPLFLESVEEVHARFPATAGADGAYSAIACLPLIDGDQVIGALGFSFASPRGFTPEDRAQLQSIAGQCALAVARSRLVDALRRSVQAREELLAVVAHDLRAPITVARLRADLLRGLVGDGTRARAHVEQIDGAMARMDKLVGDLLDFAAIDAGTLRIEPAVVAVAALLSEVQEQHGAIVTARGVHLTIEAADAALAVRCDRERVLQVLANLIGNAAKHTAAGGAIHVEAHEDADRVRFAVRDTGAGMSPAQVANAFRQWWKGTAGDPRSLGLGLFIARGLVEAHGGAIEVASAPGAGSTFTFWLPAADPLHPNDRR